MAGIYIHIPFCEKKCFYCDFFSGKYDEQIREKYVQELIQEIKRIGNSCREIIKTVYIGGGTPSVLNDKQIVSICDAVRESFVTDIEEFSMETNPGVGISFSALKDAGINRLSVGVQSLDDNLLKKIGRIHDSEQAKRYIEEARYYFDNVSADLILGLDEKQNVQSDLDYLLRYVTHLSTYMLKVESGTPLERMVIDKTVTIATENSVIDQYNEVNAICERYGFEQYEVSNYCKDNKYSKHNSSYWDLTEYIGVGAGAHSYYNGRRYYNEPDLAKYLNGIHSGYGKETVEREYSIEEEIEEFVMLALRTTKGLSYDKFFDKFGVDFRTIFGEKLKNIHQYIDVSPNGINIKKEYFLVQNSIISEII